MTEFHPPMSERETEELIEIAHCDDENIWVKEATLEAKKELQRRNVSPEEQEEVLKRWEKETEELVKQAIEQLKRNETEGYEIWEMVILFIFGPILFIRPYIFNTHTLFTLRGENYQLKFRQRLLIFALSFIAWYMYINIAYLT